MSDLVAKLPLVKFTRSKKTGSVVSVEKGFGKKRGRPAVPRDDGFKTSASNRYEHYNNPSDIILGSSANEYLREHHSKHPLYPYNPDHLKKPSKNKYASLN